MKLVATVRDARAKARRAPRTFESVKGVKTIMADEKNKDPKATDEQPKPEAAATKEKPGVATYNVKSALPRNPDGSDRVALFDKDPRHPNDDDEVFVSGKLVVTVAETPGVLRALRDGRIVKTDKPATPRPERPGDAPAPLAANTSALTGVKATADSKK